MSLFERLICNRTQADADKLRALLRKAREGTLSEDELYELGSANHRGAYNYTDLNRVTQAQEALYKTLTGYGYALPGYAPVKTTSGEIRWTRFDTPTSAQLAQYLANTAAIRSALPVYKSTPRAPADMVGLTIAEANAIEKILVDVDDLLQKMAAAWFRSGELQSGEI